VSSASNVIERVLLQNIEDGDRRKFVAKSNDSDTGGGARDLRFRPETEFLPFFRRMFTNKTYKTRKAKGNSTQIEVLSGTVSWQEPTGIKSAIMEIWPATDARPNECRIARISEFGLDGFIQTDPNGGRSVFMMFQQANGDIMIYFTTETSLRTQNWDPKIKKFAQDWFADGCKSAFLDLVTREQYPHG
jgi:hypothetical protein